MWWLLENFFTSSVLSSFPAGLLWLKYACQYVSELMAKYEHDSGNIAIIAACSYDRLNTCTYIPTNTYAFSPYIDIHKQMYI